MGKPLEINIDRLKTSMSVGIYDAEKRKTQIVFISVKLKFKNAPVEKDEMRYSIDYDRISNEVRQVTASRHFELIENLAYCIALALRKIAKCDEVQIRVDKPLAAKKNRAENISVLVIC